MKIAVYFDHRRTNPQSSIKDRHCYPISPNPSHNRADCRSCAAKKKDLLRSKYRLEPTLYFCSFIFFVSFSFILFQSSQISIHSLLPPLSLVEKHIPITSIDRKRQAQGQEDIAQRGDPRMGSFIVARGPLCFGRPAAPSLLIHPPLERR